MSKTIIRNRAEVGETFNVPPNGRGISLYNATGSAIVVGEVVWIGYEEADGKEMVANVVANKSFPVRTAVAIEAIANEEIGLFQTQGECLALVMGAAVLAGDYLEAVASNVYFAEDGASRTTVSAAVALEVWATSSSALKKVFLLGEQHTIAT